MASIRKFNSKWQVQIRRNGFKSISKSFLYRKDAEIWARTKERELEDGGFSVDRSELKSISLGDLLIRYRDTVSIKKKGSRTEFYWINAFLDHRSSKLKLSEVTPQTFACYRDQRLKSIKPSSICREFAVYRHTFQIAIDEWDIPLGANPLHKVKLPTYNDKRNRRLEVGELDIMVDYCKTRQQLELLNAIILAIETGMRRGELLRLSKEHFNCEARTLYIPLTKTGHPRTIPLTTKAVSIVNNLESDQLVYSKSTEGFMSAWQRLIKRTGIVDLRFHDLRHEAISRFFEMGLSVPEVALISGHRDYRMLQRYTHLKPEEVALKLN
jgi:integrase